jgi:UDP-N-acetylmuramyl pentapeptide phosphotransferase/UDP-N-acetylglucosamine-1-phosphate transferase
MIVENQMKKCGTQTLGGTHVSAANVTATPNAYVRFWIITMLLVLMGLATLKLR